MDLNHTPHNRQPREVTPDLAAAIADVLRQQMETQVAAGAPTEGEKQ